ncbi:carbon-monoxide dehydrogenase small subunit [Cetobacterium ceti]|uniref:Carbon-monoxide dehydrogenase small subunit n=1 Tax=Cetobacterium ceti TaxID=180163 RepID=A0A1T4KG28_9FUSO|nr:2Fe-2S iron-sulfur cluster-binding protein [Cetobacterium ceti]SJZ41369.1 carbon-monoxide dehydrogenase small subunit [Cetobacterium ceti]
MLLNCSINGIKRTLLIEPHEYLTETLRKAGFTSVKRGCDTGVCGLCTVLANGKPILSCSTLSIRCEGKFIETIEAYGEKAEKFSKFMGEEGADQCGFCSPGFTLTVIGMLKELENPTDNEILHYLNGTLCRCTGYASQLRAIKKFMESEKNNENRF